MGAYSYMKDEGKITLLLVLVLSSVLVFLVWKSGLDGLFWLHLRNKLGCTFGGGALWSVCGTSCCHASVCTRVLPLPINHILFNNRLVRINSIYQFIRILFSLAHQVAIPIAVAFLVRTKVVLVGWLEWGIVVRKFYTGYRNRLLLRNQQLLLLRYHL